MKKVIALNENGDPLLTTEVTANKHNWWITYHLTVVLTNEKTCDTGYINRVPAPGMLLYGINAHIYRVASVTPRHICFECNRTGTNRIRHTFYCDKHWRELVVTKPIRKTGEVVNRNDKCPCGSDKKYKHCCEPKHADHAARHYFNSLYVSEKSNK